MDESSPAEQPRPRLIPLSAIPARDAGISALLLVPRTPLIGREPDIAAACALLRRDDVPLVT
jgi:hypothetical protein